VALLPNVCTRVRKSTQWLFHCFYKKLILGFYSLSLLNRTFFTLLIGHSSSGSSKTPYPFDPLSISVFPLFILRVALSYVGISFIILSVIVLSVIVVIVLSAIILLVIVVIVLLVIILSVIVEDWFKILLNSWILWNLWSWTHFCNQQQVSMNSFAMPFAMSLAVCICRLCNLQARPFGPCNNQEKDYNNKPAPSVSNLVEIPDKFLETHEDVTI